MPMRAPPLKRCPVPLTTFSPFEARPGGVFGGERLRWTY